MLGWRVLKFEIVDRAGSLPILHAIFHAAVLFENQLFFGSGSTDTFILSVATLILLVLRNFEIWFLSILIINLIRCTEKIWYFPESLK